MMESTSTITDQQTPPVIPINNSSSRRKQSKPNRLEHVILETPSTCDTINSSSILPPLTQYHVAAEQQESGLGGGSSGVGVGGDDDCDRVSLNCEDGSISSHSTGEHYAMEDIINRSRRPLLHQQQSRSNEKINFDENIERILVEENEEQEHIDQDNEHIGVLDFSLKLDQINKSSNNSLNRSRSINTIGKSRSLKRKHQNGGTTDNNNGTISMPTRIFHADAFCGICRKEFCNKYFLKTHLANKHGIFDQSVVPSVSTPNITSLQGNTDTNNDSNLQHPFTVISTLLHNGHDDFSSSPPISPSSDLIQNHRNNNNNNDENETELNSLRHEMNGVIAGDEDNNHHDNDQNDADVDDDDDDDEQDGTNSNSLMNLPQKIATILCNDNNNVNSVSMLNDNDDDDDDDQQDLTTNSPTNSLDYQQQQQQQVASSSQTSILPLTPSSSTTNLSRQSSAKLPEDFCDICQKHFCNKYYLRKHKLDVHGVQTDCNIKPYKRIDSNSLSTKNSPPTTSSSSQLSSSIQLPSSFSNVTFNPSTVQQSLGMLLNPIFSPLVQSQTNSEQTLLSSSNKRRYTDNSNESSTSSLTKPQFPSSLLTAASDVANVLANQFNSSSTTATTTTTSLLSSSSSSSKSQISTCHLCGKKFQTNDYLQLHLMNKHQITTDISNHDSQQRTKLSNLIKSSNGTLNSNTVKKIKLETNETPSSSSTTITTTTVIKAASPMDTITSPNPSAVIPGIVDTYFAAKMADRVSCDICHKQVCNKYFLKTHKLKVHGIAFDPMVSSSSSSSSVIPQIKSETNEDNLEQQESRSSFDGSPPQLVVDEMNSTNTEPGVIPSPDALTNSVNTFIGINNNNNNNSTSNDSIEQSTTTICKICSKSFPTKFLHVHMNNIHGIQQAPIILTNGTTDNKTQLVGNTMKRPLTNGNNNNNNNNNNVRLKQTPQVQLRVTCQVCKKELCNKYFLRAHMRNVHNISVDDIRLVQQPSITSQLSPLSDQSSSKATLSLSSNLLSSTSIIPTDMSTLKHSSSSNDNDLNGHTTDSNDSESLNHFLPSSITTTTTTTNQLGTNDNNNNNNNHLLSMQPFLVESDDDLYKDLFVPCMVYLPCRHRVTKPLEVSLRLKPVDNTTSAKTAITTTTTAAAETTTVAD